MKKSHLTSFVKEWGFFILFMSLFFLSYVFVWMNVSVDGHSMDPTLAHGERLFVLKTSKIDRFDIVVAEETDDKGETKKIVKRVIGTPGDTLKFENDKLYVNGQEVEETYLDSYQEEFKADKLQSTYSYNKYFRQLAEQSLAFTTDSQGNPNFTVVVPEKQYYLLGDDRIVSQDSRAVGSFKADDIIGEVKFRFWPLPDLGPIKDR